MFISNKSFLYDSHIHAGIDSFRVLYKGFKLKKNIIKKIKNCHSDSSVYIEPCVNITYGADDPFLFGTGVSITSLLLYNNDVNFHFHIFSNQVSAENFDLFKKLAHQYDTKITFYLLDDVILKTLPTASISWNHSIYFRLIAIDYFADKFDSIIYLDSDIICKKSLHPLLNESFSDKKLIAVHDEFVDTSELKQIDPTIYFNSGFLYLNLSEMRKENLTDKVISIVKNGNFTHPDQDALNIIFNDNVKIIDHCFNSFFNIDSLVKSKKNKFKITPDTVLIHYVGVSKPWHDWTQCYDDVNYFKIAKDSSPWKEKPFMRPCSYKQLARKSAHLKNNGKYIQAIVFYIKYISKKLLSRIL